MSNPVFELEGCHNWSDVLGVPKEYENYALKEHIYWDDFGIYLRLISWLSYTLLLTNWGITFIYNALVKLWFTLIFFQV